MIELDSLPLYELHTMYYILWKDREEEQKMSDEEKGAKAIGEAIEDNS